MNAPSAAEQALLAQTAAKPPRWQAATVQEVRHWTPELRSLRIARPPGFRFTPGHYARLGLDDGAGGILWRPFSMVSGRDEAVLEFLVVLVEDGPFSERLAAVVPGSTILVQDFALGFLTLDQLAPGKHLWLLASGTGLGPFMSMLRTPGLCDGFERIVLAHSVRYAADLAYRDELRAAETAPASGGRLRYLPIVTRQSLPGTLGHRIPTLLGDGTLQSQAGVELSLADSRVMVCGNPDLTRDMRALLVAQGFQTSRRGVPGQMAFEKYW